MGNRCKSETDSQSSNWQQKEEHTEDEQKRCHGLILFLAELVVQMEHTSAFGLGDLLIHLIVTVLKRPAPNSVKNICQALKVCNLHSWISISTLVNSLIYKMYTLYYGSWQVKR